MKIPDDYVQLEQKMCPVCGVIHTHDCGILIHKKLRSIPKDKTVTGYGLCEEHDALFNDGYVALIGVNNTGTASKLSMEHADRTGTIAHIRRSVFNDIFNSPIDDDLPLVFVDEQVITILNERMEEQAREVMEESS